MSEPLRIPHQSILDSLFKKFTTVKEDTAALAGELGERLRTQYENNEHFTPFAWGLYKKIRYVALSNELKAKEMIRVARAMLDQVEADIGGHVGDLAEMAKPEPKQIDSTAPQMVGSQPAPAASEPGEKNDTPTNVMPLDEAKKRFEENNAKAEKRKEARAARSAKAGADSVESFRESLKATTKAGEDHIKKTSSAGQGASPAATDGDEQDEADEKPLEPPAPPKRARGFDDMENNGTYKLQ